MNFKPKIKYNSKLVSKFKIQYLYCKNFIFILLLLDNLKTNFKNIPFKFNYYFIKKNFTQGSTLRAPYKNKKAQFNLKILRYFLLIIIKINIKERLNINNFKTISDIITINFKSYNYFESTLITQFSRKFIIPFKSTIIKY